jgi:hypothetical protein
MVPGTACCPAPRGKWTLPNGTVTIAVAPWGSNSL